MTDAVADDKKARAPRSAKLPQWTLAEVRPIVQTLHDLGGPARPAVVGQQINQSAASGKFRGKMAAAMYYGLVAKDGERRFITERGQRWVTGDASDSTTAAREAVMSTSFGAIIRVFGGRPVNEPVVAARLHEDFGVPQDSATRLAAVLVAASKECGLVNESGRFDAVAIDDHHDLPPTPAAAEQPRKVPAQKGQGARPGGASTNGGNGASNGNTDSGSRPAEAVRRRVDSAVRVETGAPGGRDPFTQGVQVVVKLDVAGYTPEQVKDILSVLVPQTQS